MRILSTQPFCLILSLLLLAACKKSAGPLLPHPPADIYVLGSTGDSLVYWKNGVPVLLATDTPLTSTNAMVVSGKEVYIDGTVEGKGVLSTAEYWINGSARVLPDTTGSASTWAIFVAGSDVYVGGTILYPTPVTVPYTTNTAPYPTAGTVAVYWKNGVAVPLPTQYYVGEYLGYGSHVYSGYVSGIFASGQDVYVSGGDHEYHPGDPSSYQFALYWKNDVPVNLDNGLVDSTANGYSSPATTGIFVSGNDVYVSGFEATEYPGLTFQALYWKNGVVTNLTPGLYNAAAYSIYVNGQDVYVAGYQILNGTSLATYWKNGVANVVGKSSSSALSIVVDGNDVYMAGNEAVGNTSYSTWWKNGVATHLGTGGNAAAIAIE